MRRARTGTCPGSAGPRPGSADGGVEPVVGTAGVTPVSANLGAWGVTGPFWFGFAGSAVILALGRHRLDQPPHEYGL